MENQKSNFRKNILKGTLFAGALLSVSALSATPSQSNLFDYSALGSGSEVRSELLHSNASPTDIFEANCGGKTETTETKKGEAKEAATKESKAEEAKCGEKKAETKKEGTTTESKAKEAKCGEGKCGVE